MRRLGVPIALQSLMLAAVAAGDAIMLGRVTQNSMAAVSLATQIQFVQNMILSAVTAGGAILGAQYWGKGDTAANTTKPATFETGLTLQVPLFIETGEVLKIDTRDGGEYLGRA